MSNYKVEGWFCLGFKNPLINREIIFEEGKSKDKTKKEFWKKFVYFYKEKIVSKVDNFSLLFGKFVPIVEAILYKNGEVKEKILTLKKECIGGESKYPFLKAIRDFCFEESKYKKITERIKLQIDSLKANGYREIIDFNQPFTTNSRLVIGLGGDSVLETSLTLHKIFGIPYIPATALKGVVRAVKFWELAKAKNIVSNESVLKIFQERFYGELETSDEEIFKAQLLFGAKNFKGLLLFLDAFPEINNKKLFDVDIMNVHYQDYYTKNEPPGDWQQPTPIFFLTVKEGVKFHIAVLFDQYRYEKLPKKYKKLDSNNLQDELKKLLTSALSEFGVGAKTRLGHGVLK